MKREIFIQANSKQLLGAKIAKYALETRGMTEKRGIPVTIINVESSPTYMRYVGMSYKRGTEERIHTPEDLQFFTLSRFMPPELMSYEGEALVIDPDIFALHDVEKLLTFPRNGAPIAACKRANDEGWDTSVMVLDCSRLKHWSIEKILKGLKDGTENYKNWMRLLDEPDVAELPRIFNSIDALSDETCLVHMSHRLTQPWKTGLPVDFHTGTAPKVFGLIPREPLLKLLGKIPTKYQTHPVKNIEVLFFALLQEAVDGNAISKAEIQKEVESKNIRTDIFNFLI